GEDRLAPGASAPRRVVPVEGGGIDDLARAVHVARLEAGGRIGHRELAVDHELVEGARRGQVGARDIPAPLGARHRQRAGVAPDQPHPHPLGAPGPESQHHATLRADRGAEWHVVHTPHQVEPSSTLATVWSRTSTSTGLATWALKPAARARSRSSGVANPLTATTGAVTPRARRRSSSA